MASNPVIETFPLGNQWRTIDPFLFVAHHRDAYPEGGSNLGPTVPLTERPLGQDFGDIDGWNMYHGSVVPGFPQHPHRGFETITYVRHGFIDHSDSLGATARFGRGDVQWMTAGSGIVHSEMFPLLNRDEGNPLELFQIWLNLPSTDKMVDPYFTMLWSEDIPTVLHTDQNGGSVEITVLAGALPGVTPPTPPPNSWAARSEASVALWHVVLGPDAEWEIPVANAEVARVLYAFDGTSIRVGDHQLDPSTGAALDAAIPVTITGGAEGSECFIMAGRPIGEPVAQYGPFVMNNETQIREAFADYQQTRFGGWPWPSDDPVHERSQDRFAIHPDGRQEQPVG